MKAARISLSSSHPSEIFDRELSGEPIQDETKARHFRVLTTANCTTQDKSINISHNIIIRVPKGKIANLDSKSQQRCSAVVHSGGAEALRQLIHVPSWPIYRPIEVVFEGTVRALAEKKLFIPFEDDCELNESLERQLIEETARQRDAEVAFNKAKEFLEKHLSHGSFYPGDASLIRSAARYITECIRGSADSFMHSWNLEKSGRFEDAISELLRRG